MNDPHEVENEVNAHQLLDALGSPDAEEIDECRDRCQTWFAATAPVISWDAFETPLGILYIAATKDGVSNIEIGVTEDDFLARLNPLGRTVRDPEAIAPFARQFTEYFQHTRSGFEMRLDLASLTPFQKRVLETIRAIPAGTVWTYSQVAKAIGKPAAVRAVGHALHINPLLIVVPCHRVIGLDGTLRGYRAGLETKQRLLQLEGAL